jgi:hypothetical protein
MTWGADRQMLDSPCPRGLRLAWLTSPRQVEATREPLCPGPLFFSRRAVLEPVNTIFGRLVVAGWRKR